MGRPFLAVITTWNSRYEERREEKREEERRGEERRGGERTEERRGEERWRVWIRYCTVRRDSLVHRFMN